VTWLSSEADHYRYRQPLNASGGPVRWDRIVDKTWL